MRILLLGRSLETGGAERQMVTLACGLKERGHDVTVALFYAVGPLCEELRMASVPLVDLRKGGRWDLFGLCKRLLTTIRNVSPDTVYSFLTPPNIIAALIKPFAPPFRLVWGIRASNMDMKRYDRMSRMASRLEVYFSYRADVIIANSRSGGECIMERGYCVESLAIIPNGVDTDRFSVAHVTRNATRKKIGAPSEATLVIVPARLDPMKGHDILFASIAVMRKRADAIRFLLAGGGSPEYEEKLRRLADEKGVGESLLWLGERSDMPELYYAADACALPSTFGEGFSNVLAEAMASGLFCIATDVGDASLIVNGTGKIIPPGDSGALAAALDEMGDRKYENQGLARRQYIIENFGIDQMITRTEDAFARRTI